MQLLFEDNIKYPNAEEQGMITWFWPSTFQISDVLCLVHMWTFFCPWCLLFILHNEGAFDDIATHWSSLSYEIVDQAIMLGIADSSMWE